MPPPTKILLVDDAPADCAALRARLLDGRPGAYALDWTDGYDSVDEILARGRFDLYFVDLRLSRGDGLELIRALRARGVAAPIIALTGEADDRIDEACAAAGASDYLVRGEFDTRLLDRSIRYAMRSAATRRELERLNARLEDRIAAESEQVRLLRFAIEQSGDALMITEAAPAAGGPRVAPHVAYVNPAFAALTGRSREELVAEGPALVRACAAEAGQAAALDAALAAGRAYEGELTLRRPGGSVAAELSVAPLRDADGAVTHHLWSCRDISERKRIAETERQRHKMEVVGQLTGGIAHDFNNLLTIVIGNLDFLEHAARGDERVARFAGKAMSAAERGQKLTRQLLAFARKEAARASVVDINPTIGAMTDLLRSSLSSSIAVRLDLAADAWPARLDPEALELVLLNLAVNARDAMPGGGELRIATRNRRLGAREAAALHGRRDEGGEYVCVSVADTGEGMQPEVAARAFEPFFTTKAAGKGSGLGLSMAYGFATQSGGFIRIDSTPGAGTTIELYLPHFAAGDAALHIERADGRRS